MHEDVNQIALALMMVGNAVVVMSLMLIHAIKYAEMESLQLMENVRMIIQHQHLVMAALIVVYLK